MNMDWKDKGIAATPERIQKVKLYSHVFPECILMKMAVFLRYIFHLTPGHELGSQEFKCLLLPTSTKDEIAVKVCDNSIPISLFIWNNYLAFTCYW